MLAVLAAGIKGVCAAASGLQYSPDLLLALWSYLPMAWR